MQVLSAGVHESSPHSDPVSRQDGRGSQPWLEAYTAPATRTQAACSGPDMSLTFMGAQVQEAVGALFSRRGVPRKADVRTRLFPTCH